MVALFVVPAFCTKSGYIYKNTGGGEGGPTKSETNQKQATHCTMGLSPLDNCIREIYSFAPILQGKNCIRAKYLENDFHF